MNNPNHISQEEFERIEQYILGSMSASEADLFREELEQSEDLRKKHVEVKALISAVEEGALRNSLDKFHQDMESESSGPAPVKKLTPWFWSAAAAIALVIAAAVWTLYPQPTSHERLFAQYFQEDPGLITAMSSEGQYDFDRAMVDYKSGNYRDAIRRWETILLEKPENDTLLYFIGSSHLALKETEAAISYFEKVLLLPEGRFTEDNYWYLGLAHLGEGRMEEAKVNLANSTHPLKDQLLKTLEEK
ncbi:hypothetical protein A33Q_2651 [Indibacter alkaliphilus LW1]|uniref:Uncharacterized protein n=1 Tax=Indibacter alkaliphilus (strain CCUG 57479 / KCTC 22604 / LW1) TaxID=1189612 RepID=S2E1X9_INDAL|nr:tetratricopeptide repeat protein [Indibacter alkaliphilus]EOZ96058.1 hypothetical protein A33Q_2651 [Indibacter alkaliphilus LW1]